MKREPSFAQNLHRWYRTNARDLPWRHTSDPYRIWISEIMLQQTTVSAVIPYYQSWMKILPSVHHVARAPLQKILKLWQGLGYYQRAKNIHRSARIIRDLYKGNFPKTPGELKKLPGFGPYTTGAVLSIAFDIPYPLVDANVRRVMMRILAVEGYADPSQDQGVLNFLDQVMPKRNVRIFNQALMELGALICRPQRPQCLLCPLHKMCRAYAAGIQEVIPKTKRKMIQDLEWVVGVIEKDGKYFIQKRPPQGLFASLWEFPGGKIEEGETGQEALSREFREKLGIGMDSAQHMMNFQHFYTAFRAKLHVFLCQPESCPTADTIHKWVSLKGLEKYPMPSGSAKIVDWLRNRTCAHN